MRRRIDGTVHELTAGGCAYLPPGRGWRLRNPGEAPLRLQWIRERYEPVDGLGLPDPVVTSNRETAPEPMPDSDGRWPTTRFVDPADMRHDMHVNLVTLLPGAVISFTETHVMEHRIHVPEGKAVDRPNRDWVEVEAGDFLWLRAFCPQARSAGGSGPLRHLLYRGANRHPRLAPPLPGGEPPGQPHLP